MPSSDNVDIYQFYWYILSFQEHLQWYERSLQQIDGLVSNGNRACDSLYSVMSELNQVLCL